GGVIPYSGTFLVFSDYCRPSIRLSALMKQRVIYVMTHDSIGLGEDGPTHQPVEHLASLRAIPNLLVMRPADAVETVECWQVAIESDQPSILALSRQGLPPVRLDHQDENLCARGAYIVQDAEGGTPDGVILASGSEVGVAAQAREILAKDGIKARVVSVPCMELFDAQSEDYRAAVLGGGVPLIAVEAGVRSGWDRYLGGTCAFVGMDSFGRSAPAGELFKHFGITAERVAADLKARI
ncbi:MAG: transketolase C-terminal domain-containing protein, partial [Alphaproteobacteria bacterium]|nr:transketolase C-terminal domain-containing protein [Alphaproteobacteria bacterium]